MIYYQLIQIIIFIFILEKVILDIMIQYYIFIN